VIQVTLNFTSEQELLAFFANKKATVTPGLALESGEFIPAAELAKPAPKAPKVAATPAVTETKAVTPAPAVESHSDPKPVAAPTAQEAPAVSSASSPEPVDYATLQKAVFALAGKSREAAASVASSMGVKTFKELDAARWGDALAAVTAKLAELG
jgi:hypothetical protein